MHLIERDEAEALTEPCHEVWADAHAAAWSMWRDRLLNDPEFFKVFTPGDRYLMLHRHICDHAGRHLEGVVQQPDLDFYAQVIDGRLLVRFKHLTEEFQPRAYPTDQQQQLGRQRYSERLEKQLELDGLSANMTVITVGYTLDTGEETMSQIVAVCHAPELRYWYDITGAAGEARGGAEVKPLPGIELPGPRVVSTRPGRKTEDGEA